MLDLFNNQVVSVDIERDHGFLEGMGIDPGSKTAERQGGQDAATTPAARAALHDRLPPADPGRRSTADAPRWRTACPQNPRHQRRLHDQRAGGEGAYDALKAAGKEKQRRDLRDRRQLHGREGLSRSGTSSPPTPRSTRARWRSLGVTSIAKLARGGGKPSVTSGQGPSSTPVPPWSTAKPVAGIDQPDPGAGRHRPAGAADPRRVRRRAAAVPAPASRAASAEPMSPYQGRTPEGPPVTTQRRQSSHPAPAEELLNRPAHARPTHPRHPAPAAGPQPGDRAGPRSHRLQPRERPLPRVRRTSRSSLQQVAVVGSLAVGQTLIILTAGIDLSIGAVTVLSIAGDGQAGRRTTGMPGHRSRCSSASLVAIGAGPLNGAAGDPDQAAAVHRHPGHPEHLHRDHPASTPRARPSAPAAGRLPHVDRHRRLRSGSSASPTAC